MSSIFLPDIFADTVYDIDLDSLKKNGIKGFVLDIDNTLVTYAQPVATDEVKAWLKKLEDMGFKVYIVSNNERERVRIFSESAGLRHYGKSLKPLGCFLKKACRNMDIKPAETVLVGDQLFTDICGGNLLKMTTVLVKPISDVEGDFVKFKRKIENRVLKNLDR